MAEIKNVESSLQQLCVKWFKLQYPKLWERKLFFAVPNGQKRDVKQNKKGEWYCPSGNKSKAMGEQPGVSDMILLLPNNLYGFLCIEFKKKEDFYDKDGKRKYKYGRQSAEQKIFQLSVTQEGGLYKLVYDIDQFIDIVNEYIKDCPKPQKD